MNNVMIGFFKGKIIKHYKAANMKIDWNFILRGERIPLLITEGAAAPLTAGNVALATGMTYQEAESFLEYHIK